MSKYKIAGHVIDLGWSSDYIHDNMLAFADHEAKESELHIEILEEKKLQEPNDEHNEKPLISSSYMRVYKNDHNYLLFYPDIDQISGCFYDTQKQIAQIYLTQKLDLGKATKTIYTSGDTELNLIDYIFFIVRDIFFIFAQQKQIIAVHSSSIIYQDKAFLFSASSGTGKTTHTNMWIKEYGVEILDGDVTAICVENDESVAYGLPWCGTSQRYLNERVALGGVIFLAQSCHNSLSKLTQFESILRLSARCFTPTWNKELANLNIEIAESIVNKTVCAFLGCLPNLEAVNMVKDFIDTKL